jgi:hypothetical protein
MRRFRQHRVGDFRVEAWANAALTAGGPAFISRHYGICGGGTNNGRFSRFVDHHPHLKSRR